MSKLKSNLNIEISEKDLELIRKILKIYHHMKSTELSRKKEGIIERDPSLYIECEKELLKIKELNNSIRLILKDFPLTKIEKTYKIE